MNTEFLNFKKLMISIIIWIATWGVFDGIINSFKFSNVLIEGYYARCNFQSS